MRTTINLDAELVGEAQRITGMTERTALVHEGLRALIQRESARRLARLGGTEPQLKAVSRRRSCPHDCRGYVGVGGSSTQGAVSYTHLTLPTN